MVDTETETLTESEKKEATMIFVGLDGNGGGGGGGGGGLQESFAKFREQKMKERRLLKLCQQASLQNGRDEQFKDNLRMKFVETLKRYLGTPYALRYKAEEEEVAPLYLDCCALVRQAVQDLQQDFGFVIGKWNQAYQMDTLPVALAKEQLRPGDLIFYEGEYFSCKAKPQKHNIVHVEVFLGGETGEACIGSRYHRGKVSIFPSYHFTSTTWRLVALHFRSLDTWLSGLCTSCCPEHAWQSEALSYVEAAGKRSIFADAQQEDVSAGGEEQEEQELATTTTKTKSTTTNGVENGKENSAKDTNSSSSSSAAASTSKKPKRLSAYAQRNSVSKSLSSIPDKQQPLRDSAERLPRTYYVGKSNGWRLVKAAMDRRGWTQLPFDYQFTSRFGLKWVERRSQIDYRAHQPGQLVCHIPNNDIITTKLGLLTALRDTFCRPNANINASVAALSRPWQHPPHLPHTYDLESPADVQALLGQVEAVDASRLADNSLPSVWIYKPSCNNRGRGIKVVSGINEIKLLCCGNGLPSSHDEHVPPMKGIVQKYVENPLLLGEAGHKFDIRCYLLISRTFPTTMAFYHSGYCRLALKPYALSDSEGLKDTMMHLTNASVQKKGEDYKDNKDKQIQSMAMIVDDLIARGKESNADFILHHLDDAIKKCMTDILTASNGKLLKKHGYFDLLGCDFMLTDDNQLFLLEINTNPALSLDNGVLEELLPGVVDGALDLVLQTQGPEVTDLESVSLPDVKLPSGYELIFDEKTKFVFGK
eukprot:gene1411-1534_t